MSPLLSALPSVVYFIQSGDGGPVKIGVSTNVVVRLDSLQAGNPVRMHLIGTVPGDKALEEQLHERFAAGRIHREWFRIDTPGLASMLRHVWEHGELPAPKMAPAQVCETCFWPIQTELVERGERRCYRCLTEAADSQSFPLDENREERRAA